MGKITESRLDQETKKALAHTACAELMSYGMPHGKERIKHQIKRVLPHHTAAPRDTVFWISGIVAQGLWQYRKELRQAQESGAAEDGDSLREEIRRIDMTLGAYYARWMQKGCPLFYPDDLLAGEAMLDAYVRYRAEGGDGGPVNGQNAEAYHRAIEKMADFGLHWPTDRTGSWYYRAGRGQSSVYVDAIGLACPYLYRYGAAFDRPEAMEAAVGQIDRFLAYGMDGATGLPYHGYDCSADCKCGIIGWGRAVGWLMRGMAGCLMTAYGAGRLQDSYRELTDRALDYQRADGLFSWQLPAAEGPSDTSAAGLICGAVRQGIDLGILAGARYDAALEAGRRAIAGAVRDGRVYGCSGECEGFGLYPQRYGSYPWSLGPALGL